jgi:lipoate-protein ligase B
MNFPNLDYIHTDAEHYEQSRGVVDQQDLTAKDQFCINTIDEFYAVGFENRHDTIPEMLQDLPVHRIQRPGGWTYHGPGQITISVMINLRRLRDENKIELGDLVERTQRVLCSALLDLTGQSCWSDNQGFYLHSNNHKIGNVGLTVYRDYMIGGVTFNFCTRLDRWQALDTACGITSDNMDNLLAEVMDQTKLNFMYGAPLAKRWITELYVNK